MELGLTKNIQDAIGLKNSRREHPNMKSGSMSHLEEHATTDEASTYQDSPFGEVKTSDVPLSNDVKTNDVQQEPPFSYLNVKDVLHVADVEDFEVARSDVLQSSMSHVEDIAHNVETLGSQSLACICEGW
ncbi:hypothetical protein GOP47_0016307 [Adiantum capillus-veneris]|uniref:Uncharacterized protein n=1 Tax=Adiantum capillus-veneris TaxID=13818 RepID=A0A9D4UHV8_ADICA|nr:hypothetical protein GOP47_0016307 [Adiantum capillus-veneris]